MSRGYDTVSRAQKPLKTVTTSKEKKREEKTKRNDTRLISSSQSQRGRFTKSPNEVPKQTSQPQMPDLIGSTRVSPLTSPKAMALLAKQIPRTKPVKSAWGEKRREKSRDSARSHFVDRKERRQYKPNMVEIGIQSGNPNDILCIGSQISVENRNTDGKNVKGYKIAVPEIELDVQDTSNSSFETETSESDPVANREQPLNEEGVKEKKKRKRISQTRFEKLGLSRRPHQFKYEAMVPSLCLSNAVNPEPLRSNVFVILLPKSGGEVKTPFYTQIDVPNGALRDDVIMKFETQSYDDTKLNLSSGEKLCSQVIDINMTPLAFSLHQGALLKMRILEDCINSHEDVWIITARHFTWNRLPTQIETRTVHDGEVHFYAVCKITHLGKFAVITSQRSDKFVLTSAGGIFVSTVSSDVTIKLEEGSIANSAHVVELSVVEIRKGAVNSASKEIECVRGVRGNLVATSHVIKVRRDLQRNNGILDDRHSLLSHVHVTIPIEVFEGDDDILTPLHPWKRPTIKILKKSSIIEDECIGKPPSLLRGAWEDVTVEQVSKPDYQQLQCGGCIDVKVSLPSTVLVLVFDETSRRKSSLVMDMNINEVCDILLRDNLTHEVALMVHQKTDQPEMISIHAVPATAAKLIAKAMVSENEWKPVQKNNFFETIQMKERECLNLQFKGPLQLTINQLKPQIQFHSRGWQGYQFQVEALEDYYSNNSKDTVSGIVEFIQRIDDEIKVAFSTRVTIPHCRAKPYKPFTAVRPVPKVSVYREYKLAWMKSLTYAEKTKYLEINTP